MMRLEIDRLSPGKTEGMTDTAELYSKRQIQHADILSWIVQN